MEVLALEHPAEHNERAQSMHLCRCSSLLVLLKKIYCGKASRDLYACIFPGKKKKKVQIKPPAEMKCVLQTMCENDTWKEQDGKQGVCLSRCSLRSRTAMSREYRAC